MAATIKIKNSSTAGAAPTASDLVQGELAVNVTDKRLYTENASGTIVELGTNPSVPVTFPDGSASAPSLTNDGDTNTGLFFPAADTVGITTGGTERARVDSSGNLGLGVTPSVWGSNARVVQVAGGGSVFGQTNANILTIGDNMYWDNTNFKYIATDYASKYVQYQSQHLWFTAASGTAGNAISFTQAMTLDASGNLLLNDTAVSSIGSSITTLQLRGKATARSGGVRMLSSDASLDGAIYMADGVFEVNAISSTPIAFRTNSTERMRIDTSGNLLVGTTSVPGAGSATTGIGLGSGAYLTVQRAAATPFFCGRSNDGEIMALYSGTTQRGTVSISGATTTYGSVSDYRLKENISPITGGLSKVMALKPSTFNFKEFPNQQVTGFIAHEVGEVEPIAVSGSKDAVDEDGKPIYQAVDPAKLVALLTAAIQELKAIVDAQAAEIAALKG